MSGAEPGSDALPLDDHAAMGLALELADEAAADGEVPIGAVVLIDGRVVGAGRNRREHGHDPTSHAEVLALRAAAQELGTWRLDRCTLVATVEPCMMCAGAAWTARVARIVFGTPDPLAGAAGSLYNVAADTRLNHQSELRPGVRAEECRARLDAFFAERRS